MKNTRRDFIKKALIATGGVSLAPRWISKLAQGNADFDFQISLAQWSLNQHFFSGKLDNLDFPATAKNQFDIEAVEYVNQFFPDKAEDTRYLSELKKRADDQGVSNVLIMVDNEGPLAAPEQSERMQAVENHYKWVDAAKFLGCHSIRVNLFGAREEETWTSAAIDGLGRLAEYGMDNEIGVIVENHGGFSSNAAMLVHVLEQIDNEWAGTLPDFGNFCIEREDGEMWGSPCVKEYDIYQGVREMMPWAKGVSAKSFDFDDDGNETTIDFRKMLSIVKDSGFTGTIGVEYEGSNLPPEEGIQATKLLLEKIRSELS
ncbi:MAG: TIM barrel protein [Balneolaceae bacterium]